MGSEFPSTLALDSKNIVHISYYDPDNGILQYTTNASGSWETEEIDSDEFFKPYSFLRSFLVIDSSDVVHIFYYTSEGLKHATIASDAWITEIVDAELNINPSSLDLDSSDKVHISYENSGALQYATNASEEWVTVTIDSEGRIMNSSLVVDSNDNVHICYFDYDGKTIKYANKINQLVLDQ
jgi:hypothetical protein